MTAQDRSAQSLMRMSQDKYGKYIVQRMLKSQVDFVRNLAGKRLQAARQPVQNVLSTLAATGYNNNGTGAAAQHLAGPPLLLHPFTSDVVAANLGGGHMPMWATNPGVMAA